MRVTRITGWVAFLAATTLAIAYFLPSHQTDYTELHSDFADLGALSGLALAFGALTLLLPSVRSRPYVVAAAVACPLAVLIASFASKLPHLMQHTSYAFSPTPYAFVVALAAGIAGALFHLIELMKRRKHAALSQASAH